MTTTGRYKSTKERVEREAAIAQRVLTLAHKFIKEGVDSGPSLLSAVFLARASQALDSTSVLSAAGLIGDAMSVARTVVELDIEHAYIFAADVEDRMERYIAFEATSVDKIMGAVNSLHGGTLDQAALAALKQRASHARQLAGSGRNWADRLLTAAFTWRVHGTASHQV